MVRKRWIVGHRRLWRRRFEGRAAETLGSPRRPGRHHHHFTTSKEPARHLALRRGLRHVGHPWRPNLSEHEGGHLLEHEDEPPEIHAMYEAELKKGIPLRMRPLTGGGEI
jgi:hypothetical protein